MAEVRKLISMGGGTLLVSIPKKFAVSNNMGKGSKVLIEQVSPNKLLISPALNEEKNHEGFTIMYNRQEVNETINDLTASYLLGYELVTIEGKSMIDRKDRTRIKDAAKRLIGLEIVDEDLRRISFQFLIELKGIEPDKIIKRMSRIIEGMLRDISEGIKSREREILQAVKERDDELDRLYFLLVRVLRSAARNPEMVERYGLSLTSLLDYRVLASYLESIGDTANELADVIISTSLQENIADFIELLSRMFESSILLFLAKKKEDQERYRTQLREENKELDEKIERELERSQDRIDFFELVSLIKRIAGLFTDIADLSAPVLSP